MDIYGNDGMGVESPEEQQSWVFVHFPWSQVTPTAGAWCHLVTSVLAQSHSIGKAAIPPCGKAWDPQA